MISREDIEAFAKQYADNHMAEKYGFRWVGDQPEQSASDFVRELIKDSKQLHTEWLKLYVDCIDYWEN